MVSEEGGGDKEGSKKGKELTPENEKQTNETENKARLQEEEGRDNVGKSEPALGGMNENISLPYVERDERGAARRRTDYRA